MPLSSAGLSLFFFLSPFLRRTPFSFVSFQICMSRSVWVLSWIAWKSGLCSLSICTCPSALRLYRDNSWAEDNPVSQQSLANADAPGNWFLSAKSCFAVKEFARGWTARKDGIAACLRKTFFSRVEDDLWRSFLPNLYKMPRFLKEQYLDTSGGRLPIYYHVPCFSCCSWYTSRKMSPVPCQHALLFQD